MLSFCKETDDGNHIQKHYRELGTEAAKKMIDVQVITFT
jgi:hypothetical protein